jgi:hypothetical protein
MTSDMYTKEMTKGIFLLLNLNFNLQLQDSDFNLHEELIFNEVSEPDTEILLFKALWYVHSSHYNIEASIADCKHPTINSKTLIHSSICTFIIIR